ncbi:auxin-binding protein ABP19a-like protein [Tanacetum coccineum]
MIHVLLIICSLFTFSVTHAGAINLCVADLKGIKTPSGYSCKPVKKVSVDDFVYMGLRHRRKISKNVTRKASVTRASVAELPALNGQGVSISRVDLPRGFRTSAKKVFVKTLKKDDIMVIPQGLEHFIQDANEVASVQQNGDYIDLVAELDMLNMDCDYGMRSDEDFGC